MLEAATQRLIDPQPGVRTQRDTSDAELGPVRLGGDHLPEEGSAGRSLIPLEVLLAPRLVCRILIKVTLVFARIDVPVIPGRLQARSLELGGRAELKATNMARKAVRREPQGAAAPRDAVVIPLLIPLNVIETTRHARRRACRAADRPLELPLVEPLRGRQPTNKIEKLDMRSAILAFEVRTRLGELHLDPMTNLVARIR